MCSSGCCGTEIEENFSFDATFRRAGLFIGCDHKNRLRKAEKMKKKLISAALCAVMILSLGVSAALAAGSSKTAAKPARQNGYTLFVNGDAVKLDNNSAPASIYTKNRVTMPITSGLLFIVLPPLSNCRYYVLKTDCSLYVKCGTILNVKKAIYRFAKGYL